MMEKIRRNRFAENLKALRIGAGLNQIALAKLLGIAQPAVARYETGVREPDLDDLMTIAERLGTTPNDLLGFESPPQSAAPGIKVGDIKGNSAPVVFGNNNAIKTVVPPPSSLSSNNQPMQKLRLDKKKGKRK